ncbi:MAG: lytic murein transglycosylase [Pseudohongiella sp.]|nr:lytic murein transglycosylase [Pseudohongiella sp.]MDP2128434.1 lytic murein transglycosylase [Pseudohongiella sp.]
MRWGRATGKEFMAVGVIKRRFAGLQLSLMFVLASLLSPLISAAEDPDFQPWLQALITEAREAGISESIIEQALVPVTPIPQVISNDRNQAEFVETLAMYLEKRVTAWRINTGRERLARHAALLDRVSAQYGVSPRVIVAIWGIETNYGSFTGGTDVIRALVTLAYDPRRATYFRGELLAALQILQEGHISHADMKGSWAGAMGQSQFMPSSFRDFAVDFDGDGRRDIWTTEADVFASIANYLAGAGWREGERWGREVQIPGDYHARSEQWQQADAAHSCSVLRRHTVQLPVNEWQMHGVRQVSGADLPAADIPASMVFPDGIEGQAFLTYPNFRAILRYNCANNYALAVATLADSF